jgi:hypothetical protein
MLWQNRDEREPERHHFPFRNGIFRAQTEEQQDYGFPGGSLREGYDGRIGIEWRDDAQPERTRRACGNEVRWCRRGAHG